MGTPPGRHNCPFRARLLGLPATISLMLGINLGITLLAHFIAFRFGIYPLLAVGIGFFIYAFGQRHYTRYFGYTLLGFGLVFIGLNILTTAMEPLVAKFLLADALSQNRLYPLWGYLFGLVSTTLVQSNIGVIGLLQAAAGQTIGVGAAVFSVTGLAADPTWFRVVTPGRPERSPPTGEISPSSGLSGRNG